MKNKKTIENITTRVDPKFKQEMREIKEDRLINGNDKKKMSDREITGLIPKHNFWRKIKEDIINLTKDKRGQFVLKDLFVFSVIAFVMIVLIASFVYIYFQVDASLSGNILAGQVNLSNTSSQTIGQINTAMLNNADLIGILFLFGLVLAIMLNGFLTREMNPSVFFIIDFIILIFAYILSVYISNSYETILALLPFTDLVVANLPQSSRFLLLLPKITLITGAITLIVTYAGIPRTKEEEVVGT